MSYARQHLQEAGEIITRMDDRAIESMVEILAEIKQQGGRLFFLGVGGSAGNCSHAHRIPRGFHLGRVYRPRHARSTGGPISTGADLLSAGRCHAGRAHGAAAHP